MVGRACRRHERRGIGRAGRCIGAGIGDERIARCDRARRAEDVIIAVRARRGRAEARAIGKRRHGDSAIEAQARRRPATIEDARRRQAYSRISTARDRLHPVREEAGEIGVKARCHGERAAEAGSGRAVLELRRRQAGRARGVGGLVRGVEARGVDVVIGIGDRGTRTRIAREAAKAEIGAPADRTRGIGVGDRAAVVAHEAANAGDIGVPDGRTRGIGVGDRAAVVAHEAANVGVTIVRGGHAGRTRGIGVADRAVVVAHEAADVAVKPADRTRRIGDADRAVVLPDEAAAALADPADRARRIGVADRAGVVAHQAAESVGRGSDIDGRSNRTRRIGVADRAVVFADEATGIFVPNDRTRGIGVADRATGLISDEAADVAQPTDRGSGDADIADGAGGIADETDIIASASHIVCATRDRQVRDPVAEALERAGENTQNINVGIAARDDAGRIAVAGRVEILGERVIAGEVQRAIGAVEIAHRIEQRIGLPVDLQHAALIARRSRAIGIDVGQRSGEAGIGQAEIIIARLDIDGARAFDRHRRGKVDDAAGGKRQPTRAERDGGVDVDIRGRIQRQRRAGGPGNRRGHRDGARLRIGRIRRRAGCHHDICGGECIGERIDIDDAAIA